MEDRSYIAPHYIEMMGVRFPATYRISSTAKTVTCEYYVDDIKYRVVFTGMMLDFFTAAKQCAMGGDPVEVDTDDFMTILETAKQCKAPVVKTTNPSKEAHGEIPPKWFIGLSLTGVGYRIYFDGDIGKTRVIFKKKPSQAQIDLVKAHGFYWSPTLKSWNKGLNFKAYRAAEKLHMALS